MADIPDGAPVAVRFVLGESYGDPPGPGGGIVIDTEGYASAVAYLQRLYGARLVSVRPVQQNLEA